VLAEQPVSSVVHREQPSGVSLLDLVALGCGLCRQERPQHVRTGRVRLEVEHVLARPHLLHEPSARRAQGRAVFQAPDRDG
jgi:hypothetical protein